MMIPDTEDALATAIRDATSPLRIQGGGTRHLHRAPDGDTLCTSGLSGITLYDPGALTIVAKAGTPVAEIEKALAAENQRLAFEPMDHRGLLGTQGEPTLGGVVAANVSGPRRVAVGACRDFVLGVRFVDGNGTIIKNGGRVMKNVTGYDLAKLMTGSHGTLGVLTEVALKVLPDVACTGVLLFEGLSDAQAIAAMSAALGSPFEVTGAAHLAPGIDGQPVTMIRIEGFAKSVRYRAEQLTAKLADHGKPVLQFSDQTDTPYSTDRGWTHVRDVLGLAQADGDIWRLSVKPSDAAALVTRLETRAVQYDWGGGLIWALTPPGYDLRGAMGDTPGHATLIRSSSDLPRFHPEPAAIATLNAGLRQRFDPRNILNPGLMN